MEPINRKTFPKAAAAALALVAFCLSSCTNPVGSSASHTKKRARSAIAVSLSVPARTAAASEEDFAAAIESLAIAVVDGSGTTVASDDGIAFGTGTVKTFGSIPPGNYTIAVNAYGAGSALIATGSAAVSVSDDSNADAAVSLSFSRTGASGGLSLALSWPVSTALAYVRATLDGADLADPPVASDGTAYTATVAAANLAGGAHLLLLYFKTSAGAAASIGPFAETVNVWDGVTSASWIDQAGNSANARTFAAAEFSSSNADLAGLTFGGAATTAAFAAGTADYAITGVAGPTISFTATAASGSQDVAYTWNGAAETWNSAGETAFTSQTLAWNAGVNTLSITVTAADRQTTKTYTATFTMLTAANLATALAADLAGSYVLTADIDTTGGGDWTPIGDDVTPFTGTFDGNGHTVTLQSSAGADYNGLFGAIGETGRVVDLNVDATLTSCGSFAGAVAGQNSGTVEGCSSTGSFVEAPGATFVGGIVGDNDGTLTGCRSDVAIDIHDANWAAGVVAGKNTGTVRYCWSEGTITGAGYAQIGGLVGHNSGAAALVDQCFSSSAISGVASSGGLIGQNDAGAAVRDSYSTGTATGVDYVGALVGISDSQITRCYTIGTGTNGALLGYDQGVVVTDCYYNADVQASSDGGTAATTAEMKTATTFTGAGWDLTTIWGMSGSVNDGYPYLRYLLDNTNAYD